MRHEETMDDIDLQETFDTTPAVLFEAWVDGDQHAAFTGAEASSEPRIGGSYTAWEGYIAGTFVELEPGRRIVQRWRTVEFPADAADSLLEVTLEPQATGTLLRLRHTGLPPGDGPKYTQGWREHYFEPLHEWLARR
jgi:uncharacterized protein YndB with AHSA1/START domain